MAPIYGVIIAYLAGSIPSAYIAGKLRGVDLRQHGSGNLGATNVVRVLGPKTGAVVFLADFLKGFLPVYFLPMYTETLRPGLWRWYTERPPFLVTSNPFFYSARAEGRESQRPVVYSWHLRPCRC